MGRRRTLLVLPTGCGKTIVFAKIAEDCVRRGNRVLILAHRGELLEQAADKIRKATGLRCAVEKAEESCLESFFRITVGSVQTLMREKRLHRFAPDYFDTIIIDEAHHCISDSYRRILEYFWDARVLGVTATPAREPFLKAEWVRPGTHISCVGADMTGKQEIDSALFSAARVFGDDAAQCLSVGECEIPYKNGIFDGTLCDIGGVISGAAPGRTGGEDITIFDSTGIALQDISTAAALLDAARKNGQGQTISL